MTTHDPVKVLAKKVAARIRKGWTQWASARDKSGQSVPPNSPRAVRWCLYGAYRRSLSPGQEVIGERFWQQLKERCHMGPIRWQDYPQRTKAEVLRVLREVADA